MKLLKNMADVAKLGEHERKAVTAFLDEQEYLSWAESREFTGIPEEFQHFLGGDIAIVEVGDGLFVPVFGGGEDLVDLLAKVGEADSVKLCNGFFEVFWTTNNSGGPTLMIPNESWLPGKLRDTLQSASGPQLCPACRHDKFSITHLQQLNAPGAAVYKPGRVEYDGCTLDEMFDDHPTSYDLGYTCEKCGLQTVMVDGCILEDKGQDVDKVAEEIALMLYDKMSCPRGLARTIAARAVGLVTVAAAAKAAQGLWDAEKWSKQ